MIPILSMGLGNSKEENIQEFRNRFFYKNGQLLSHIIKRKENQGSIYEGEISNDKKDGHGVLEKEGQFTYIGQFKNDQFNGMGKLFLDNGEIMEGKFVNGKFTQQPANPSPEFNNASK